MPNSLCTVVSIEYTRSLYWQTEVLWNSFQKVNHPGRFLCLVSAKTEWPTKLTCPYIEVKNYRDILPEVYTAFNKPGSILEWLKKSKPQEENILIIDPDCFFVDIVHERVEKGQVLSNYYNYMDIKTVVHWNKTQELIERHLPKEAQSRYQPCGIPNIIHRDDLEEIAKLWLQYTIDIRSDAQSKKWTDWIAEMYGYNFAIAHLGLDHKIVNTANRSCEPTINKPIVHYPDRMSNFELGWSWQKRMYKPWQFPGKIPPRSNNMSIEVLHQIIEVAKKHKFQNIEDGFEITVGKNFLNPEVD